jgi:hypothetical protein
MRLKRIMRFAPAGTGNYKICAFQAFNDIYVTGSFGLSCVTAHYDKSFHLRWFANYQPRSVTSAVGKALLIQPPGISGGDPGLYVLVQTVDTAGFTNLALLKYDTLGNFLFEKAVETSADEISGGLQSGYGNGVYVVGYAADKKDSNRIFIHKYAASGEPTGTRVYRNPTLHFRALKWVGGAKNGFLTGGVLDDAKDLFFIRFDSLGEFQTLTRYETPEAEISLVDIKTGVQGDIVMTAASAGDKTGKDFLTVAFGPDNKPLWAKRYDGTAHKDDIPKALMVDDMSNAYVAGASVVENGQTEIVTLSYDCAGNEKWSARYAAPGDQNAEPYDFEPLYTGTQYIGQHDLPTLTLTGTQGKEALILKYKLSDGVVSLRYGLPGRLCRPAGITSRYLLINITGGETSEAAILSYGPFEIPGINRWD